MKTFILGILLLLSSINASALEKMTFFTWPGDVVARATLFTQLAVTNISDLDRKCLNVALVAEQRLINALQSQASLYKYAYGTSTSRTSKRPVYNTQCSFYVLKGQSGSPDLDLDHSYSTYKNLSTLADAQQLCEQQRTSLLQQRDVLSVSASAFHTLFEGNVCSLGIMRLKRN